MARAGWQDSGSRLGWISKQKKPNNSALSWLHLLDKSGNRSHDDDYQNNNTDNQADSHLGVLPPHALADSVGTALELARGLCKLVGLVLQTVESLASVGHGLDVLVHDVDRVVQLALDVGNAGVGAAATSVSGVALAAAGEVWIIGDA